MIPGMRVHTIDVSCSGMAGTFGLTLITTKRPWPRVGGCSTSLARPEWPSVRRNAAPAGCKWKTQRQTDSAPRPVSGTRLWPDAGRCSVVSWSRFANWCCDDGGCSLVRQGQRSRGQRSGSRGVGGGGHGGPAPAAIGVSDPGLDWFAPALGHCRQQRICRGARHCGTATKSRCCRP